MEADGVAWSAAAAASSPAVSMGRGAWWVRIPAPPGTGASDREHWHCNSCDRHYQGSRSTAFRSHKRDHEEGVAAGEHLSSLKRPCPRLLYEAGASADAAAAAAEAAEAAADGDGPQWPAGATEEEGGAPPFMGAGEEETEEGGEDAEEAEDEEGEGGTEEEEEEDGTGTGERQGMTEGVSRRLPWAPDGGFVGQAVAKRYGRVWHYGYVSHVSTEVVVQDGAVATQWKVAFEDGDTEDMLRHEVRVRPLCVGACVFITMMTHAWC